MITSLKTLSNNNHPRKYDHNQLLSNTQINFEENMSILTNNNDTIYQKHENKDESDGDGDDEDDNEDETSKLVSIKIESIQQQQQHQQYEKQTSVTTLRSILRKRSEKKMSTDVCSNVQQTSITINENINDYEERDSDYTGDETDEQEDEEGAREEEEAEESNGSNKSIEKESKNNEQEQHQHSRNYSRHRKRDQFFRTSPSTPVVLPLEAARTETRLIGTGTTKTSPLTPVNGNDQSSNRTPSVKFTNEQPTIIHRSSSTPQLSGFDIQPRSSVTYINMKEDISTSIPITTMTNSSATLGSEFRPVYVSPLKYRPLVGLSSNDNRLLLEKRVSLLGKPVIFHPIQKRSPSYRRAQLHIYNFLERPRGYKAIFYHTFVFSTVFICLFLSVVVTMPDYESIASTVLLQTEVIVVIWLSTELGLRVWSAGCCSRYQTLMGRLRFLKKPFCALDFIVIVATVITLCLNSRGSNGVFAASALRGLRFFQILRMLRMDRRGGTWKLLGSVVYAHRQELITTIYIEFLVLIFSSFVMFLVEKDSFIPPQQQQQPFNNNNMTNLMTASAITELIDTDRHKFETFADALWWGIITLCTVGYGDKVPSSNIGKLLASICSFIGISFFALPAGILGSGFALKVQQQQRQKHYKRRKIPAVLLIQNLWRVYAADEKSLSKATWKVHVRPPRKDTNASTISQTQSQPSSLRTRHNQSFLNRVSFRRRTPTRETPPTNLNSSTMSNNNTNMKPGPHSAVAAMRSCIDTLSETASITPSASMNVPQDGSSSDNEEDRTYYANDVESLTPVHRNAIRFIRKIKYFVSRRKFREALRPYDVTDVIEQYSTGNVDMLARMKYLQARLDKVLGMSKSVDSYESGPSLASRICKIERQVDTLDVKIEKLCQLASNILERNNRQQVPTPAPSPSPGAVPITPIIVNRFRTGHYFPFFRRQQQQRQQQRRRRRIHSRTVLSTVSTTPVQPSTPTLTPSTRSSSRTNLAQPSVPPPTPVRDHSRESLVSLYWLFQDNINPSRTYIV